MQTVVRNLLRYLTGQGLISRRAIVDGGLTVAMSRSRNRFLRVKQRNGPSYFIKQALATEPGSAQTVAREAEIYRGVFADERLASVREFLPGFHFYSEDQGVLVTELLPDAENLSACHARLGEFPAALGAKAGRALAACHRVRFAEGRPQAQLFPQRPPWILTMHAETDHRHLRRSTAASEVVDLLLQRPGLGERLAGLAARWSRDTLIHVDMRWENCLLDPRGAPVEEQRLYFIDWELADIGDAAWDVGSLFQAYLVAWIHSMPSRPRADPETLVAEATRPIEAMRPAVRALWEAYAEGSAEFRSDGAAFLEKAVDYMAARMLVSAFEMSAWTPRLESRAVLMLQTALNVLDQPADAARDLLGLALVTPVPGGAGRPPFKKRRRRADTAARKARA
jgi:aminoglycoside phosphotransferase (APT) family kinase protein